MNHYTYLILFKPTSQVYYGSRSCACLPEQDLFQSYFTSSKVIKNLLKLYDVSNFDIQIRKSFKTKEACRKWESKVLSKMKVVTNNKFLNQAVNSPMLPKLDIISEKTRRNKISLFKKMHWQDPAYRNKILEKLRSPENREKCRINASMSAKNKIKKVRKKFKTTDYKLITISKNEILKEIYSNQYSAYKKYGWLKI